MAEVTAGLVQLCHARRVWYIIEQPLSNLLYRHPILAAAIERTGGRRHFMELGRAGATSPKPLVLVGTAPWMSSLSRQIKRRPMVKERVPVVETSGRWVNGKGKALAKSAIYPPMFTDIVATAHAAYLASRPGSSTYCTPTMTVPEVVEILSDDE